LDLKPLLGTTDITTALQDIALEQGGNFRWQFSNRSTSPEQLVEVNYFSSYAVQGKIGGVWEAEKRNNFAPTLGVTSKIILHFCGYPRVSGSTYRN